MTVYVDEITIPPYIPRVPRCFRDGACHMWADSAAELHAMAQRIGLKRAWFQPHRIADHYDLTPMRRLAALRAGAEPASMKDHISNLYNATLVCPAGARPTVQACIAVGDDEPPAVRRRVPCAADWSTCDNDRSNWERVGGAGLCSKPATPSNLP